jgi:hypothetical protein
VNAVPDGASDVRAILHDIRHDSWSDSPELPLDRRRRMANLFCGRRAAPLLILPVNSAATTDADSEMSTHSSGTGLFARSRARRRLLVLRHAAEPSPQSAIVPAAPAQSRELHTPAPAVPVDVVPVVIVAGSDRPRVIAEPIPVAYPVTSIEPVAATESPDDERPWIEPEPSDVSSPLATLLASPRGLTWVIAGDSLEPVGSHDREWRSYSGRLAEQVRVQWGRHSDGVIIQTEPAGRIVELERKLTDRVLRYTPDIVYIAVGLEETRRGLGELDHFESALSRLVERLQAAAALVVLATPPCIPTLESHTEVDQQVYAAAVRAIAAEYETPLVDHFAAWELAATHDGALTRWLDTDGETPGAAGHRQITETIVRELGLAAGAERVASR